MNLRLGYIYWLVTGWYVRIVGTYFVALYLKQERKRAPSQMFGGGGGGMGMGAGARSGLVNWFGWATYHALHRWRYAAATAAGGVL